MKGAGLKWLQVSFAGWSLLVTEGCLHAWTWQFPEAVRERLVHCQGWEFGLTGTESCVTFGESHSFGFAGPTAVFGHGQRSVSRDWPSLYVEAQT